MCDGERREEVTIYSASAVSGVTMLIILVGCCGSISLFLLDYLRFTVTVWLNRIFCQFYQWYYSPVLGRRCNVNTCPGGWIGASAIRAVDAFFLKLTSTLYKARLSCIGHSCTANTESNQRNGNGNKRACVFRSRITRSTFAPSFCTDKYWLHWNTF